MKSPVDFLRLVWVPQGGPSASDFLKRLHVFTLPRLSPDVFDAHLALQHRLQRESQGVQVRWLHESSQHTWCVLEILLGINDSDIELLLQLARAEVAGELAT